MFDRRRRVERQIQWVCDNYPVASSWSDLRVERLIRDASEDTKVIRFIVAIVGSVAVALLGVLAHQQLADYGLSAKQSSAIVTIMFFIAGLLISGLLNLVWRRVLQRLANGT